MVILGTYYSNMYTQDPRHYLIIQRCLQRNNGRSDRKYMIFLSFINFNSLSPSLLKDGFYGNYTIVNEIPLSIKVSTHMWRKWKLWFPYTSVFTLPRRPSALQKTGLLLRHSVLLKKWTSIFVRYHTIVSLQANELTYTLLYVQTYTREL